MTGRTHKEFAITFTYFATFYVYSKDLINLNYYALLVVMLCIGAKGAKFPDVDHAWKNVSEKTFFNFVINKFIHLTGGKHRSRQTHSWDICLMSLAVLIYYIDNHVAEKSNYTIYLAIVFAFYSGWISHLLSDMLTVGGCYLTFWSKNTVRLVPKRLFGIEFKTGDAWENFFYKVDHGFNVIMSIIALAYPVISQQGFLDNLLKNI